jgi:hypothetical protein
MMELIVPSEVPAMHCDDVFDALTHIPARRDGDVVRHLRDCARCRDLDEALAALHTPDDRDEFPASLRSDRVFPAAGAVHIAQAAAQRLRHVSRAARSRRQSALKYVAAFLAGAAASFGMAAALRSAPAAGERGELASCSWLQRDGAPAESSQKLVRACMACHLASSR